MDSRSCANLLERRVSCTSIRPYDTPESHDRKQTEKHFGDGSSSGRNFRSSETECTSSRSKSLNLSHQTIQNMIRALDDSSSSPSFFENCAIVDTPRRGETETESLEDGPEDDESHRITPFIRHYQGKTTTPPPSDSNITPARLLNILERALEEFDMDTMNLREERNSCDD